MLDPVVPEERSVATTIKMLEVPVEMADLVEDPEEPAVTQTLPMPQTLELTEHPETFLAEVAEVAVDPVFLLVRVEQQVVPEEPELTDKLYFTFCSNAKLSPQGR
jgi:hypothetical protein